MSTFITALKTMLALIPSILDIIKAIEVPGNGAAKLAAVTQIVLAAFEALPEEILKLIGGDKISAFISKIVSILVTFLNAIGVFKHEG